MSVSARQSGANATGIVVISACLMTIGLVMVASAGASLENSIVTLQFWKTAFGRQAMFSVIGFIVLLVISKDMHRLFRWRSGSKFQPAVALYLVTIICLAAALTPGIGTARKGARRWLQLGPAELGISFQPSELAKLAMVILLAAFLASRWKKMNSFWRGLLPGCLILGVCAGLVGIEDFGTAALLAGVGVCMLIIAGARWWHLVIVGLPGAVGLASLVYFAPYRMQRLTAFLDIWSDPQGAGYHPIQSLVSVASGSFWGRGLGAGIQKYGYLPESRSDFIFGVISEETGMIGAVCVIGLFVTLLWLGKRVVHCSVTNFGRLLAFGITMMFGLQALINISVVLVVAPTKGISLPLVSAGGSGVIFLGAAMGLLASVAREPDSESLEEIPDCADDMEIASGSSESAELAVEV